MKRNLLLALFSYRPRTKLNPQENFLTEAFAYLLEEDEVFAQQLIAKSIDKDHNTVHFDPGIQVRTQNFHSPDWADENESVRSSIRPDMELRFSIEGKPRLLFFEHKWESCADQSQLKRYWEFIESHRDIEGLVFIGRDKEQCRIARESKAVLLAMTWGQVHKMLDSWDRITTFGEQFMKFLEEYGLVALPPLQKEELAEYVAGLQVEPKCRYLTNQLLDESRFTWDFLPERFGQSKKKKLYKGYGRIGIQFIEQPWEPGLFAGFLLDPSDHKLELVDRSKGIDLVLFIEGDPKYEIEESILNKYATAVNQAETRQVICVTASPDFKNPWRKLAIQKPLLDVIETCKDGQDQADTIYECLKSWGNVLFADGQLELAFCRK